MERESKNIEDTDGERFKYNHKGLGIFAFFEKITTFGVLFMWLR